MTVTTHPNGEAPTEAGSYRLGAKGGRMAKAWQYIWDRFDGDWQDGLKLAQDAATEFDLKPISISEMLCRMRAAGVIEQEMIYAPTQYVRGGKAFSSNRKRVHYRINQEWDAVKSAPDPDFVKIAPPSYGTSAGVRVGPSQGPGRVDA